MTYMAHKNFNRMRQTVSAPGASSFIFTATPQSAQSFGSRLSSTDRAWYTATNGTAWEVGYGTWTSPSTLARTDILESSNSDLVVNFSTGLVDVWCDPPASVFDTLNLIEESIASATTCNIGALHALRVNITGTTTITGFGTVANKLRFVRFSGALTLTHNATSLILPGSANIVTVAGDTAILASDSSGNWRCFSYSRGTLAPLDGAAWTSYSPTLIGSNGNAIASYSITYASYKRGAGKKISGKIRASITTVGSAGGAIKFDLPVSCNNQGLVAGLNSGTNKPIGGLCGYDNATTGRAYYSDATFPAAGGETVFLFFEYEEV